MGGYLFCGSGTVTITNTVAALVNGIGITTGKSTERILRSIDRTSPSPPTPSHVKQHNRNPPGAGLGTMIMAGWLVRTNNLTGGVSAILAVYGQGTDLMVMAGGAVLTFNRIVTRRPALLHVNKGLFGVWIAGNGFFLRPDMLVCMCVCIYTYTCALACVCMYCFV